MFKFQILKPSIPYIPGTDPDPRPAPGIGPFFFISSGLGSGLGTRDPQFKISVLLFFSRLHFQCVPFPISHFINQSGIPSQSIMDHGQIMGHVVMLIPEMDWD